MMSSHSKSTEMDVDDACNAYVWIHRYTAPAYQHPLHESETKKKYILEFFRKLLKRKYKYESHTIQWRLIHYCYVITFMWLYFFELT